MPAPIATIDQNGVTTPLFADVLSYFQQSYAAIYGADVNLSPDTQDGQWLAVVAAAVNNANLVIASVYHAYSPTYAQGAGLSSVVKINGIRRLRASNSTVLLQCIGIAGRDIGNTVVGDSLNLGSQWLLPPSPVTIPPSGEIEVTATCLTPGAIVANVGTLTQILTPVPGWQTVTNPFAAVVGFPVESDAVLRRRQTQSVANPSQSVVEGIQGAIENLLEVERVMVYENPYGASDINGIPPYSMAVVVEGGDAQQVANTIALRKTPGSPTYGNTQILVIDGRGVPSQINFFELSLIPITVTIAVNALPGFTATIETEIIDSVIAYLATLPIGYDSYYTKLIAACQVPAPDGLTYDVTAVLQSRDGAPPAAADVMLTFIEAATADTTTVTLTVNPPP